eukprot:TRINITY_DN11856_c0_g1_i1.p1 TRINITY_DN11856_c0_g1~~TRINITY_DN11856_c0_g1_i1.p1  ORF type:complete len:598 (-),score=125.09 TRINITY_DN11856_c0_g1_i1:90-1883(-)
MKIFLLLLLFVVGQVLSQTDPAATTGSPQTTAATATNTTTPPLPLDVIALPAEYIAALTNNRSCEALRSPFSHCSFSYKSVFAQNNLTQLTNDRYTAGLLRIVNLSPKNCRKAASTLACLSGFPQCQNLTILNPLTNQNVTFYLPRPPCRPLCRQMFQQCSSQSAFNAAISQVAYLSPGCDRTASLPIGLPNSLSYFPEVGWNVTLLVNGSVASWALHRCNDASAESSTAPLASDFQSCPKPLVADPNPGEGAFCSTPCPDPTFSDSEYTNVKTLLTTCGWISFVLTLFVILSYCMDPSRRKFPKNLPIMICCCSNIISIGVIIPSMGGYQKVWCDDKPVGLDNRNGPCVIQGIFLIYGALSGMFWWLGITAHLFIAIVLRKSHEISPITFAKVLHSCCWGIPLPLLIIGLAARKVSFFRNAVICFVNLDGDSWWQYGLFYIPIILTLFFGIPMLLAIFYKIWEVARESKTFPKSTQIRIGCFLVLYTYIWLYFISFRFHVTRNENDFRKSFENYVRCNLGTNPDSCTLDRLDYNLWMLYAFNIGAQGLFCVIAFGSEWTIYRPWLALINPKYAIATTTSSASWQQMSAKPPPVMSS